MATLYQYTKEGNQIWSVANASLLPGTLDYIGNGAIMTNNSGRLGLWRITNKTIKLINNRMKIYSALQTGTGVACNHTRISDDIKDTEETDLFNFDAPSFFYTYTDNVGDNVEGPLVLTAFLAMRNLVGGTNTADIFTITLSNTISSLNGCCWDGEYFYYLITISSVPITQWLRKCSIIGSTFTLINNIQLRNSTHTDICFDGVYFWCTDTTGPTIRQYSITKDGGITEVKNFTAPAGVSGITTDGTYLYIIGT